MRRKIVGHLAKRLAVEFIIASALVAVTLLFLGQSITHALLFAILGPQVVVVARTSVALLTSPLNVSVINTNIDNPVKIETSPSSTCGPGQVGVELGLIGFHPVATAGHGPDNEALFDVLQSQDAGTTAALGRHGHTITLISRLDDGRTLVTADLLVPPAHGLIVNYIAGGGPQALAIAHRRILDGLERSDVQPVPAAPSILSQVLEAEHSAYEQLGPFLAPFCSLDNSRGILKMGLRLDPAAVLQRGMKSVPSQPTSPHPKDRPPMPSPPRREPSLQKV